MKKTAWIARTAICLALLLCLMLAQLILLAAGLMQRMDAYVVDAILSY